MTLEDLMLAFIADYPNGHLMTRHDPLRTVGQWTATAYCWRGDGDSPAEAIGKLRERVVSNTISELPELPDGQEWTCSKLGTVWRPEDSGRAAWLREGIVRMTLFGPPPPLSVVSPVPVTGDTHAGDERLYVPVKA